MKTLEYQRKDSGVSGTTGVFSNTGNEPLHLSPFVKKTIKAGKQFTDDFFPPNINSLLDEENGNGGLDSKTVNYFKKLVWRPTSEIYLSGTQIFKKGVEPDDIK